LVLAVSGLLAWLAEGGTFNVLHDSWRVMSKYNRGRGREKIAEIVARRDPGLN